MANKKKNITESPDKIEETTSINTELEEQETSSADNESETEPEQEAPAAEETESTELLIEKSQCPFEATIAVALAVLRKSVEPGTAEMLKPVATLKRGTKITIVDIHGSNARLANGLWIALEYITR